MPDFSVGAGRGRDGGWVRLLVVGGRSGRWSVRGGVPDQRSANDQHGAHGAPVGPGVGRRGQRGGVEQGRGGGKIGTARQRRLPGRVGRWRQAGRSGLSFSATGHGGQTGQTGAEEQHGGGFGNGGCPVVSMDRER